MGAGVMKHASKEPQVDDGSVLLYTSAQTVNSCDPVAGQAF